MPAYLLTAVVRRNFKIANACFAQGFFFNGVPRCRGAFEMPLALILDRKYRPAATIHDQKIHSLAVYRAKRLVVLGLQNLAQASLSKDAVTFVDRYDIFLNNPKRAIFRCIHNPALFEGRDHHGLQLLSKMLHGAILFDLKIARMPRPITELGFKIVGAIGIAAGARTARCFRTKSEAKQSQQRKDKHNRRKENIVFRA